MVRQVAYDFMTSSRALGPNRKPEPEPVTLSFICAELSAAKTAPQCEDVSHSRLHRKLFSFTAGQSERAAHAPPLEAVDPALARS